MPSSSSTFIDSDLDIFSKQIKNIYLNYIDKEYKCDMFFPFELFDKNDKFHVIEKRIVNNTDQYIMKVDRELYY